MKKIKKYVGLFAALAFVFGTTACSNDASDSSGSKTESEPNTSEKESNTDGTTTLKIQEGGTGFVSSTFTEMKDFPGYSGSGYLDGGTIANGTIVYTVSAKNDITDAKIAIHYLATEIIRRRAALVSVNGEVLNESAPLQMTTDVKVKKDRCTSDNWKDTTYLENVPLRKGSNSIIITGSPSWTYTASNGTTTAITDEKCYLNYVDYLIVIGKGIDYGTDTTEYVSLSYASENETAGTVESSVTEKNTAKGTSVTFTATANTGWVFDCWSDGTTTNPYTKTISESTILFAHFISENYTVPTDDGYMGYATVTSDNAAPYKLTGGAGAADSNKVTISNYTALTSTYAELLSSDRPAIIYIDSVISTAEQENPLLSVKLNVGSNKTIYGNGTGQLRNISLVVEGENIIIRNMKFGEVISWDGYVRSGADDALSLNGATHVWVDHCEFQSHLTPQDLDGNEITSGHNYYSTDSDWAKDFYDGLLDIKNGSTWITVSNCYFHDHYKAVLCASGDNGPDKNTTTGATDNDMRITFYGNYFKNVNARMPLFRYGKGHILNTYFDAGTFAGQASCINVRAGSELLIEGNYFNGIKSTDYTIGFYYADSSKTYGNVSGAWKAINNNTANGGSSSFSVPYTYTAPTSYPTSAPTDKGATLTGLNY